jgi:hypothetical protein
LSEQKLSEIADTLKELLVWTKFVGMKEVKSVLTSSLDSDAKKLIHSLSDGNKGSAEIAAAANVSDWTVRNYWKIWNKLGIMVPLQAGSGQRFKKSFDLEEFGIEVPKIVPARVPPKKADAPEEAK